MPASIRLRPRLAAAANMINGSTVTADIGCDHGRLCAALLQQSRAASVIASDISAPSLDKARLLMEKCGLEAAVRFVVSDGLNHLTVGEADTLAITGMGGELISEILSACPDISRAASNIVMQPMGGAEELRRYLYNNGFCIYDETLSADAGRIYQIIAAKPGAPKERPSWFPQDEFSFGYILFEKKDPLLIPLLEGYRDGHMRRLEKASRKGISPAPLLDIIKRADNLIKIARELQNEAE